MSFQGRNPKVNWLNLEPQSADPASPNEGDIYRSNGTPRPVGLWEYRNSSWQKIGSDVASESLIIGDDATFEGSVGAWLTYADAAGTQPVDGTGGSPNITFARTTTGGEILNGAASAKLSKTAANRQGQGASLTLSVPELYRGKPVNLKFFYKATANFDYGTFSDFTADPSDIIVQVYDVTNAQLLNPLPQALDGTGAYSNLLQIPTNCTSLRVILHIATTNALAWDFIVDDFTLEVALDQFLKADSDWISFTPTTGSTTGFGAISGAFGRYRKVGDSIEVEGTFTSGTVSANPGAVSLPTGLVIDSSKLSIGSNITTATGSLVGTWNTAAASGTGGFMVTAPGTSTTLVYFSPYIASATTNARPSASISGNVAASASNVTFNFKVPIVGWTSGNLHPASVGLNSPAVFTGTQVSEAVTGAVTNITFTRVKDTTGSWATNIYTVRSPGDYQVNVSALSTVGGTLNIYKNGSVFAVGASSGANSGKQCAALLENLNYGDTISIRHDTSATITSGDLSIYKVVNATQPYAPRIAYIKDVQVSGTAGGSSTSGAYQTRVLNNLTGDTSFITLASNQFTLQPGTYHIEAMAPSNASVNNKIKIRNITDSLDVVIGTSMTNGNAGSAFTVSVQPTLIGTFSITSAKVFELQHRVSSSRPTDGYGSATSFGDSEIYAQVKVTKVL